MSDDELSRDFGLLDATAIGLGTMIGGGIFILPSIAAAAAGPASAVSFVVGGAISLLSALSHAELATDMPASGGGYQYVHRAFGPLLGSVVGWGMWVGLVFATAFYAVGFGRYLAVLVGGFPVAGIAAALVVTLVALNCRGAAEAGELEDLVVLVLLVVIAGYVALGAPSVEASTLRPFNPAGWGAVVATTGTVYVSLIGFSLVTTVAGEVERPERNVPLSMLVSVVVPTVLYVLVMLVSTGVLPTDELSNSPVPVARAAETFAGRAGALVMVAGAVLATASSANASVLSAGRVSLAMGRDRVLTDWFARVHDSYRTPYRAVLATGVGIVALVVLGVELRRLAEVASFAYLVTYALVHVAVVKLRRDADGYDPSFRIPDALFPAVPALGVLGTLAVMTQMDPVVVAGGSALLFGGAAWYWFRVR